MSKQEVMVILLEVLLLWSLSQGGSIKQSGSPFEKSVSQADGRRGCFLYRNLSLLEISRLELVCLFYGVIGPPSPHILERVRLGKTLLPAACSQAVGLNGCLSSWALCASWLLALDINQSILFFLDKHPSFWIGQHGLDPWFLSSRKNLSSLIKCFQLPLILASHSVCRMPMAAQSHISTHTHTFSSFHCLRFLTLIMQDHGCMLFLFFFFFTRAKLENLLNETTFAMRSLALPSTQWMN